MGQKVTELLRGTYRVSGAELFLFERNDGPDGRIGLSEESLRRIKPDFAIFAAGGEVSAKYVPIIAEMGGTAIDNSSHFRMDSNVPLVIPEINMCAPHNIIANPNCSTIQSVLALAPLHEKFGLKRVSFTTYQAISGAGKNPNFVHPILNNAIPHIDVFKDDGYTREEHKMMDETRKILGLPELPVTATCVRVPIENCHSVSILAEFEKPVTALGAWLSLKDAQARNRGIIVVDDTSANLYPMPILADGRDEVFVGRIRKSPAHENAIELFCVADNIRKGAATNAIQILHALL